MIPLVSPVSSPDSDINRLRLKALDSLYFFCVAVLGYSDLVPSLHLPLCRHIQSRLHLRKGVGLGRSFFKTTIGSVAYSLFRVCHNPNIRILLAFNTHENAKNKVKEIKDHVEKNRRLQALFPEIIPDFNQVQWSADKGLTFQRSGIFPEPSITPAGVTSDLASRHYDLIIEDDPIASKRDQFTGEEIMPSPDDVEKGVGFHRMLETLQVLGMDRDIPYERLYLGTRWGVDDLIGWILENEDYSWFIQSCENEDGTSRYPDFISDEKVASIRQTLGPYMYSTQYLLQPTTADKMSFRPDWLDLVWTERESKVVKYLFVDPCHKKAGSGSKSGFVPVHVTPQGFLNIHPCIQMRTEPNEVVAIILDQVNKEYLDNGQPPIVVIEDVGAQHTYQFYLQEKMDPQKPFHIREVHPLSRERKDERIAGLTNWFSAKRVRFAPYETITRVEGVGQITCTCRELLRQLKAFPYAADKDLIDALSYAPRVISIPSSPEAKPQVDVHSVQYALNQIRKRNRRGSRLPQRRLWGRYEDSRRDNDGTPGTLSRGF